MGGRGRQASEPEAGCAVVKPQLKAMHSRRLCDGGIGVR